MTEPLQPRIGPGQFQWNFGGWFGSSLGSTVWMLGCAGLLMFQRQFVIAMIPLGFFLFTNAVALEFWRKRDRISPFPAIMTVLGILAIAIPTIVLTVEIWGSNDALQQMEWQTLSTGRIQIFLMAPVMMIWFFFVERLAKSSRKGQTQQPEV